MDAAHLATWVRREATPAWRRIHARVAPITRSLPWTAAVETVLVAGLAAVAGQLIWAGLEPPPWADAGVAAPIGAHERQTPANIGMLTSFDAFHRAVTAIAPASVRAPETMLNLQLFGIRADSGPGQGSAIIATPDNKQDVYFIGQEIMAQVRLEAILQDRVVIRRNGVAETLSFDRDGAKAPQAAAPVPARHMDVDLKQFMTMVRLSPRENGGGLVLESGTDAEMLKQSGLEPGDVLISVNGTPLTSMAALVNLAANGAGNLSVEIERKGQRKVHDIKVDR